MKRFWIFSWLALTAGFADVGDPQIRTDHPWYAGELSCSTFERLFATQAELYKRVVGVEPKTDEEKALAAWLWRNTHYAHGEEGAEDLWGKGFQGGDLRTREYWTGLFAHGFGLCGTTHAQWSAEMSVLLGHNRGRAVGVEGHNSFEVFLKGGAYGDGKWVLLDHDISTAIFDEQGTRLLSIREVKENVEKLARPSFAPKQRGWPICGLHPDDGAVYRRFDVAEYFAGYAGAPPLVHLRRGETLRRYLQPGLEDGKTFVFWGRNYNSGGVPGPERSRTWVNQPEKLYGAKKDTGYKEGQARFANAVYVYQPDFVSGDYREGIVDESANHVTFEFFSPYIIAATPPNKNAWGVYESGCKNGLVLRGKPPTPSASVSLSVDQGKSWLDCGAFADGLDLTDRAKGRRQYLLRLGAGANAFANSGLTITTVCQTNSSIIPRLKENGSRVTFLASGRAIVSAGPNLEQARARIVAGNFGEKTVTLEVKSPRGEQALGIHAAAHIASGNPPNPNIKYQIEYSTDSGKTWKSLVRDWQIARRGDEPGDFWSQSFCWGATEFPGIGGKPFSSVQVRFSNDSGRNYMRAEAHLLYETSRRDSTKVTFDYTDDRGAHRESRTFAASDKESTWDVSTGKDVQTRWVEFEVLNK